MSEELSVRARIDQVIANELGVDLEKVQPDARFVQDLGADSLDAIQVVMALEEELDIEITDEQSETWRTVGDVHEALGGEEAVDHG